MAKKISKTNKKKNSRKKGRVSGAVVTLAVLAIALFLAGGVLAVNYNQDQMVVARMRDVVDVATFYAGISVDGIDLAGMTLEQAQEAVRQKDAQTLAGYAATIKIDAQQWNQAIPVTSNALNMVTQAYQLGRYGDLEARYEETKLIAQEGRPFYSTYVADPSGLRPLVENIEAEVKIPVKNSEFESFDSTSKTFVFTKETEGYGLDVEALVNDINIQIESGAYPIEAHGQIVQHDPLITQAQLQSENKMIASFTTKTTNNSARNKNIQLCASAFDGAVVMPGAQFSLNEATGERNVAKGYQEAGAIKDGILVPEPGGGVCQVSSTLFNAVVRAGLQIDVRVNHSYPISYVKHGHDAMINYPNMDFVFTNNSDSPIFLVSDFANNVLTLSVYGIPILPEGESIELREVLIREVSAPATEYIEDASQPYGYTEQLRPARKGYIYDTFVDHYKDGQVILTEEKKFRSTYRAFAARIVTGTMEPLYPIVGDANPPVFAP